MIEYQAPDTAKIVSDMMIYGFAATDSSGRRLDPMTMRPWDDHETHAEAYRRFAGLARPVSPPQHDTERQDHQPADEQRIDR